SIISASPLCVKSQSHRVKLYPCRIKAASNIAHAVYCRVNVVPRHERAKRFQHPTH
ncbi:hypothetical protein BDR05DRAFT_963102, partial [Suillus weaverae]